MPKPSHGSEPEPHSHSWDLRWFVFEALGQEECHVTLRMLISTSKLLKEPLKAGFHTIADDRGSQIADRKKFCDRLRSYGNTLERSPAILRS